MLPVVSSDTLIFRVSLSVHCFFSSRRRHTRFKCHWSSDVCSSDLAQQFSRELFEAGVFAMAIGFPTVPRGKARLRVMISASHQRQDLDQGLEAFAKVGRRLGVIT